MIRIIKPLFILLVTTFVNASETDLYDFSWLDKDKEVYVLQNRKFRKNNTFHVSAGYGMTASGAFVDSSVIQGRAGYFFSEDFGFEVVYSLNSGAENDAALSVRDTGTGSGAVPFRRIVDNYMGGMLLWSPFYSKINTFNSIIYVDFIFGLGVAKIEETNNKEQWQFLNTTAPETTESHTGVMWNVEAKFYLSQDWNVKFDVNGIHYQAQQAKRDDPQDAWYNNLDMTLSVGYDI